MGESGINKSQRIKNFLTMYNQGILESRVGDTFGFGSDIFDENVWAQIEDFLSNVYDFHSNDSMLLNRAWFMS